MSDAHWLRLWLDLNGTGLWRDDGMTASPEDVPISTALAERIQRWQDDYDRWDRTNNDGGSPPECAPGFPFDHFDREGAAIGEAMRAELPGWTIIVDRCWRPDRR